MKSLILIAMLSSTLVACAHPRYESPPPVVDYSMMDRDNTVAFEKDERECRKLQVKAMPTSLFEALAAPDVNAYQQRRQDKATTIMKRCLENKGHKIIY
jgi:hypothetical protein